MTRNNNPVGKPEQPDSSTTQPGSQPPTEADIDQHMAYVDGVNGSAGHSLEDPYLRGLVRKQFAGEITGDQARELGREYLESGLRP